MKILAIDTTSDMLCIGLRGGGRDMEYDLLAGKRHAAFCLLTVERILAGQGWQAREIDYFACGLGPGSFTGIRTGVATVKGMAWAVKKPVVGVPSLDLLARNALEARESFDEEPARPGGRVVAVTDARRGLLYACVYRREGNSLRRISPYMLLPPRDLLKRVKDGSIILGDGARLLQEVLRGSGRRARILDKDYWRPQSRHLLALAAEKIVAGEICDALRLKPVYLYPKECQVRK
jgi:tRNA threonylcarbamoyladenosine biosynthesis protein TsaB